MGFLSEVLQEIIISFWFVYNTVISRSEAALGFGIGVNNADHQTAGVGSQSIGQPTEIVAVPGG